MTARAVTILAVCFAVLALTAHACSNDQHKHTPAAMPPAVVAQQPDAGRDLTDPPRTTSNVRASRSHTNVPNAAPSRPRPPGTATDGMLDQLATCESGRNPTAVSRNGLYYGAFQMLLTTWRALGGTGNPIAHTYEQQRDMARKIPVSSWRYQFPACARKLSFGGT